MPTSAMLKKDEPPKQKVGSEEEDCTKNDSVFVKLALLQSKDVFVSCNNHCHLYLKSFGDKSRGY